MAKRSDKWERMSHPPIPRYVRVLSDHPTPIKPCYTHRKNTNPLVLILCPWPVLDSLSEKDTWRKLLLHLPENLCWHYYLLDNSPHKSYSECAIRVTLCFSVRILEHMLLPCYFSWQEAWALVLDKYIHLFIFLFLPKILSLSFWVSWIYLKF